MPSSSVPRSTRLITTNAVRVFVPLAIANTVSIVLGTSWARSASPYAVQSSVFARAVHADHAGESGVLRRFVHGVLE